MENLKISRGETTRARIVAIARDVLTNEGLEAFALRDIAKRAGIQLGNLQYYFATREDLVAELIEGELASNLDAMHALEKDAGDLGDYMKRLAELMIQEYTGTGGKLWPVLRLLRTHSPRFRELSRHVYQLHFDAVVTAMRRFGVDGRKRDLLQKAQLITALIDGAALQAHIVEDSQHSLTYRALRRKTGEMAAAIAAE